MIKSETKTETTTTLVLNEEQVTWLKGIMQNPMFVDNPAHECEDDKTHRIAFWQALGGR